MKLKQKTLRWISVVLTLTMVLTMFPVSVIASDTTGM